MGFRKNLTERNITVMGYMKVIYKSVHRYVLDFKPDLCSNSVVPYLLYGVLTSRT